MIKCTFKQAQDPFYTPIHIFTNKMSSLHAFFRMPQPASKKPIAAEEPADPVALLPADPVALLPKRSRVIVVTYTDEHSIGKDAVVDFAHGVEKGIVACNNARLKKAVAGDLVVVRAADFFLVGALIAEAPEEKDSWKKAGGESWEICWKYKPLSTIIEITKEMRAEFMLLCEPLGINSRYLLNSRLCPYAAVPVFEALTKKYPIA